MLDRRIFMLSHLLSSSRRGWHNRRLLSIGLDLNVDRVVGVNGDGLVPGHPGGGGGLPDVLAVGRVEGGLSTQTRSSQPVLGRKVSQKCQNTL